ncbi:MAG: response regulator [Deltaproteobacteria bacterium]|nr:response regulator [Deltaproteobacteria bacterium]MBW2070570.1 response regulator [Deltaproteobacteria bacterium]
MVVQCQKLLLVDDEEGIRKVLSIALQDAGYQVLSAPDGEAGLELFRREHPALVVTDIKMPGMDGIALLRHIKAESPDTEVIVITGHGDIEVAIKALQLKASDFITKPIHDEALTVALKRAEEKLRLRRELQESQRQVLHAEKIASLGRLAAGVAHEINNPLAGILIYAEMLMKEMEDNNPWRQDLAEIITQTLRCKQITNRLLEFSRQSLGRKIRFDVNFTVEQAVAMLEHQAIFHNIFIDLDLQQDMPPLVGDPDEFQQVVTNLLLNAADAMEGRGRIAISTWDHAGSREIVLRVEDTGPGIPQDLADKIFEPFVTTKPSGTGTGLGLAVAFGVIKRHSGSIVLENPGEQGACFAITIPVQPPASSAEREELCCL